MIYDDYQSRRSSRYGIMVDRIVQNPAYNYEISCYEGALVNKVDGVSVNKIRDAPIDRSYWVREKGTQGEFITWVSPFNQRNQLQDLNTTYGNEVQTGYIYCSPCIVARVPAASDRV